MALEHEAELLPALQGGDFGGELLAQGVVGHKVNELFDPRHFVGSLPPIEVFSLPA